ncbi:MAG: SDR family oxidoreductase [Planctomycetales bacterium]|nr:SDR family oxidoreductase [Planctomycetales bacterium]
MNRVLPTAFDLTGRVALVTGGSKGLGKAMARGFAEAGADVVICSRHQNELDAAIAEITEGLSVRARAFVVDMCDRRQVEKLAADALAEMGRVDILVNNAGSNVPQSLAEMTEEGWDRIIELNLTSCIFLTKALVPQMIERSWGRVIHIASIMGLGSKEARHSYSATKAALIGEARSAALELGPHGITVNCLAPGPFLTDLPGTLLSDEEKQVFSDRTALGRWGDPRELAGPALLLASDAGSYITGETLVVDGGAVCKLF